MLRPSCRPPPYALEAASPGGRSALMPRSRSQATARRYLTRRQSYAFNVCPPSATPPASAVCSECPEGPSALRTTERQSMACRLLRRFQPAG